jgi:HTH-type transcriptional regulator, competence development regulator
LLQQPKMEILGCWMSLRNNRSKGKVVFESQHQILHSPGIGSQKNERAGKIYMTFGQTIRELRKKQDLTQRELAAKVGINFTYLSKIENDKLQEIQFPSEETIVGLAKALDADVDELLLLAQKVPDSIKERIIQRPDVFRKIALLDDADLNSLLETLEQK